MDMSTTQKLTAHLDTFDVDAILEGVGITAEADGSFTLYGRTPRANGGKCGTDYLWQKDEAFAEAVAIIAEGMIDRGLAQGVAV